MILLFETLVIVLYMFSGKLGFGSMLLFSGYYLFVQRKTNNTYVSLGLMILSLPLAYSGLLGFEMHQLYSWYNIYLLLFVFTIIRNNNLKIRIAPTAIIGLLLINLPMIINLSFSEDLGSSIVEIIQINIMIIPIIITHYNKTIIVQNEIEYRLLFKMYSDVCVSTSIGMIIQFAFYNFLGRSIGMLHFSGAGRVSYYCMFRGASILPIFMGVGFLCIIINILYYEVKLFEIIKAISIFTAMVLNSSRAGLAMMLISIVLIILKRNHKGLKLKTIIFFAGFIVAGIIGINYVMSTRAGLNNFLDENGRSTTLVNGINIWLATPKNILLGEGFVGGRWTGITKTHNVLIQTLAQCGIIVTAIAFFMIGKILLTTRKSIYFEILLYILLTGMLVTDFYANAFTTVFFIIIDVGINNKKMKINEVTSYG